MRGAFVPPFVKKGMDGPGSTEAEGALSARTLQMLGGILSSPAPVHVLFMHLS